MHTSLKVGNIQAPSTRKNDHSQSDSEILVTDDPLVVSFNLTDDSKERLTIKISSRKGALNPLIMLLRDLPIHHQTLQNVRKLYLEIDTRGARASPWAMFKSHKKAEYLALWFAKTFQLLNKLTITTYGKDRDSWVFVKTLINAKRKYLLSIDVTILDAIPYTRLWFLSKTLYKFARGK